MTIYSIKDLEKISGIKAHTIRIWEQRYDLLTPMRSDTNIRSYDDDQAKKLINVSTLVQSGFKISAIANLDREGITEKLNLIYKDQNQGDQRHFIQINDIIKATLAYDQFSFERELLTAIIKYGFEGAFENILYPALNKIGQLWTKDKLSPSQEHFLSNIIKQKLYSEIDKIPVQKKPKKKFVLFLPDWEDHEIGLLYGYYLIKKAGFQANYLGVNVPSTSITETVSYLKPDYLFTFLIIPEIKDNVNKYFQEIGKSAQTQILISGNQNLITQIEANIKVISLLNPVAFKEFLSTV